MEKEQKKRSILQYVSFYIGSDIYALDVMKITGIEKPVGIRPIPGTPDYIKGIIDVRGHMVPVIDTKKKMGITSEGSGKEKRIILVEAGKKMMGLEVDDVKEVFQIEKERIETVPMEGSVNMDKRFMVGVVRMWDKLVIILDPDNVCSEEERGQIERLGLMGRK
jgi:purine-binding chemotaxis protein CheW